MENMYLSGARILDIIDVISIFSRFCKILCEKQIFKK